jgi:hypothetical protein
MSKRLRIRLPLVIADLAEHSGVNDLRVHMLRVAVRALYQAKANGRDHVEMGRGLARVHRRRRRSTMS